MSAFCFTVDVEDWFQAENLRSHHPPSSWDDRESRVEFGTRRILDAAADAGVNGTFFVLGWVAGRHPGLVKEISAGGHEVASHGWGHIINSELSENRLREDLASSRKILEDITGSRVCGYRAPCFSVSDRLLEMLREEGYRYDSSLNPFAIHDRYGHLSVPGPCSGPFTHSSGIVEFPMPMGGLPGIRIPVSGGGYFRLYPVWLFLRLVRRHMEKHGLYIFYMHPWEVDPGQPRTPVKNPGYRFRHYYGLNGTMGKLRKLLAVPGEKRRLGDLLPLSVP
jgi:polysaccharide deacetylase family protein (PEP-CTERM system associated)